MSERVTEQGDKVAKFPETAAMRKRVAEVRQVLVAAFEQAEQAGDVNDRIGQTDSAERGRFGVLGGDGR